MSIGLGKNSVLIDGIHKDFLTDITNFLNKQFFKQQMKGHEKFGQFLEFQMYVVKCTCTGICPLLFVIIHGYFRSQSQLTYQSVSYCVIFHGIQTKLNNTPCYDFKSVETCCHSFPVVTTATLALNAIRFLYHEF